MNVEEILIKNPINSERIAIFLNEVRNSTSNLLLINFDKHEFESLSALKSLKSEFNYNSSLFNKFTKIALLHPPKYSNTSEEPNKYEYFSSKKDAINWLKSN